MPRFYVTALARVDRADRHPVEAHAAPDTEYNHIHFEFETGLIAFQRSLHETTAYQPVARLVIQDFSPHRPGQAGPADRIRESALKRHLAEVAIANDQVAVVGRVRGQKLGDFSRIVLP